MIQQRSGIMSDQKNELSEKESLKEITVIRLRAQHMS